MLLLFHIIPIWMYIKSILLLVCIITELTKIKPLYAFCLKKVTPVPSGFGAVVLRVPQQNLQLQPGLP